MTFRRSQKMIEVSRRQYMATFASGVGIAMAGCGNYRGNPPPKRELAFTGTLEISELENGYELKVGVSLAHQGGVTIKDITLLAYDKDGARVARHDVGTLDESRRITDVTTQSSGFPAIITFEAATSACEDLILPLAYVNGSEKGAEDRDWNTTTRKCGGGLPPERILERYRTESPTQE